MKPSQMPSFLAGQVCASYGAGNPMIGRDWFGTILVQLQWTTRSLRANAHA